jgi:crotonobetainyl-CoA hydratase
VGADDGSITAEVAAWKRSNREIRTVFTSEDAREGPLAFAQKRAPVWKAR